MISGSFSPQSEILEIIKIIFILLFLFIRMLEITLQASIMMQNEKHFEQYHSLFLFVIQTVEKHVLCVMHMLRQKYGRTNKIHTLVHSFLRCCSISEGSRGTFITILLQPTNNTTTTAATTVKL